MSGVVSVDSVPNRYVCVSESLVNFDFHIDARARSSAVEIHHESVKVT